VVSDRSPRVPVTVIVYEPAGVDDEVLMVHVLVKVELPEEGLKEAEAPDGRPDAESVTVWVDPLVKVTVIVLELEPPCVTAMLPELLKEK